MATLEQELKQYFGFDAFLPGQRELIEQVVGGRDAFALMPTGAGKSLIYQLSSQILPGLTVVVSPLIALMQDQVERLQANGIPATFVNSMLDPDERTQRERAALRGEFKLLYVAPERLLTPIFLALLDQIATTHGLSLLAVDEAHCISEWGHDFRPEYRRLGSVRQRYPQAALLALTATATERVRADILAQLGLRRPYVHIASFNRPNLYYEVRQKDKRAYKDLLQIVREQPDASTIIYCQSRKGVEDLSEQLNHDGVRTLPYHAGLSSEARTLNQTRFIHDDVPVLVATIAFGLGIAKPDVRTVIHYDLPRNLEGYYQESGRAGRDGQPAQCILFFSYGDKSKIEYLIGQKTTEQEMRIARQQLQQVIAYCESGVCRRRVLLGYFGETATEENCGNCDVCLRPATFEDRTVAAQKLLSCVGRSQERFGLRYVIDILRGAATQKIRDFGHDRLSTYGVGKDLSADEWLHIGRALVHQGFLRETSDGYSILKLTPEAREVLRGNRVVQIAAFAAPSDTRRQRVRNQTYDLDDASAGLFKHLREVRKQLADEHDVPAYVIFPDVTLRALALQRPQSRERFGTIPGVGARKLEIFYDPFAGEIRAYCEAHNLAMDVDPPAPQPEPEPERPQKSPTHQITLELFREGLGIDEIAARRSLAPGTIGEHLVRCIEAGDEVDVSRLLSAERLEIIAAAFAKVGANTLSPVREYLGEDYNYNELRLARAVLRRPAMETSKEADS